MTSDLYSQWLEYAVDDADLVTELNDIRSKPDQIHDRFYRDLEFGTGGLRGVLGVGTNRMNIYTVRRATEGLAEYLLANFTEPSVAISYDCRIKSRLFADKAANVLSSRGIAVYLFDRLTPTPTLSFAVRHLGCSAGIMITASHNPAEYNGYKVYGADGCQITDEAAEAITKEILKSNYFENLDKRRDRCRFTVPAQLAGADESDSNRLLSGDSKQTPVPAPEMQQDSVPPVQTSEHDSRNSELNSVSAKKPIPGGLSFANKLSRNINYLPVPPVYVDEAVFDLYYNAVLEQRVTAEPNLNTISIVYTPLHGAGLEAVSTVLEKAGYTNVEIVPSQRLPDGSFPTCPYPNPELPEALSEGIKFCCENYADILLATDPDCDRVGVAVPDNEGNYRIMTGNEIGVLLLDYICAMRLQNGTMPKNPVAIKTIVTTDMASLVAAEYGITIIDVLTGFKYIGETIGKLEETEEAERFIFGFEESCGYLSGSYARDKDAVNACLLICDMASHYAQQGITLIQRMDELYKKHGYYLTALDSFSFGGEQGFNAMQELMRKLRGSTQKELCGLPVLRCVDYLENNPVLPKSDVLQYSLQDGVTLTVRPSGTEPKLKVYYQAVRCSPEDAGKAISALKAEMALYIAGPGCCIRS